MVDSAHRHRLAALTLCDRDGLYGVARAYARAREIGQKLHVGAELTLALDDVELSRHASLELSEKQQRQLGRSLKESALRKTWLARDRYPKLIFLVKNQKGYANLCWLLTRAHAGLPKGESLLELDDLPGHTDGLMALLPTSICPFEGAGDALSDRMLARLRSSFDASSIHTIVHRNLGERDPALTRVARHRQRRHGLAVLASSRAAYHHRSRKRLADILACIRHGTTLSAGKTALSENGQSYLRSASQMLRLFADEPSWVTQTVEVAAALEFDLGSLKYHFPCQVQPGQSPDQLLATLSFQGAARRYPEGIPATVQAQLQRELALIQRLEVAPYFLSTWEIVEIARERGILCQGRGSAANSAVCYALGITAVDPAHGNLLFERFLSEDRKEPPDIDVDFEHERREEVIQEIYRRYGRDRAAMVSEVICYRRKSALRDVAKAFGLSGDQTERLIKAFSRWHLSENDEGPGQKQIIEAGLDAKSNNVRQLLTLAEELRGFPRHLSIHVGGFVLSARPLHEVAPIEPARMQDRSVIPWDKDDLDTLGFFKIDVLALGMLTAIRKALQSLWHHGELRASKEEEEGGARPAANRTSDTENTFDPLTVVTRIPAEDPAVYALTSLADTVGVFQIESRAQMAMLPRLRPRCFYDLIIEVAIVRPGPIQGGMVHPYLRRRNGEEAPSCHPLLHDILKRTLGVPLFQEQVMRIAIVGAGYAGGEADQLRRDMAAWKKTGKLLRHRRRLLDGFAQNGIDERFGEALFEQIKGFGEYGFPESHAASFALLVYASAWLKAHHPAHFLAALLNSQPMGFYSPSSLVRDARQHGVEVRSVCALRSQWDCTLELRKEPSANETSTMAPAKNVAVRLGLRMIKGLSTDGAHAMLERRKALERSGSRFVSLQHLMRSVRLPRNDLEALAESGAFAGLERERRQALWAVRAPTQLSLFRSVGLSEPRVTLPPMHSIERMGLDYERVRLSINDHPLRYLRKRLEQRGVLSASRLTRATTGDRAQVAGLVLNRQRPGTASGVVFVTLEDETGVMNLVFYSRIFDKYRWAAQHSPLLLATGKVERKDPNPASINPDDPRERNGVASIVHLIVERAQRLEAPRLTPNYRSRDFR